MEPVGYIGSEVAAARRPGIPRIYVTHFGHKGTCGPSEGGEPSRSTGKCGRKRERGTKKKRRMIPMGKIGYGDQVVEVGLMSFRGTQ